MGLRSGMCFVSQYKDNFKKKNGGGGGQMGGAGVKNLNFWRGFTRKNREKSGRGGWAGGRGHEPQGSYAMCEGSDPQDTSGYRASEASGIRHDAH